MSLRSVHWLRSVGLWLCATIGVAVAGCSAAEYAPQRVSVPTETAPTDVAPVRGGTPALGEPPLEDVTEAMASPSSAVPSGPFEKAGRLFEAVRAPTGLQAALGPRDWPGPLMGWLGGRPYDGSLTILGICERPGLLAEWEAAGGPGALVPQFGMYAGVRKRVLDHVARCTSDSAVCHALQGTRGRTYWSVGESPRIRVDRRQRCEHRWLFVISAHEGTDAHGMFFRTRSEAQRWAHRHVQEARTALTMDEFSQLGFHGGYGGGHDLGCDSYAPEYPCLEDLKMNIRFAPADAPEREVSVLAESVAAHGGVLRGLVRNWSRHLWAYGMTVTADGREFKWPLSMQPGELAPFEIAGWVGPADPGHIQISARADMSPHADPSRAFGSPGLLYFEIGTDTRRELPDKVRDRFAQVTADVPPGSVSWATVRADNVDFVRPRSHPSLDDDYKQLVVEDLRAYGVIFDSRGRVLDVGPATIHSIGYQDEPPHQRRYAEVISLPGPYSDDYGNFDAEAASVTVLFDVHLELLTTADGEFGEPGGPLGTSHVYYIDDIHELYGARRGWLHGDSGIWIGAAYPERAQG